MDRLPTFDDRGGDVWCEEGATQHTAEVGSIDLMCVGGLADASARTIGERRKVEMSALQKIKERPAANVHDMILYLPNGYDAPIGDAGAALSGGQRQRIALARALYGDPFLVVLDEPNSNLDNEGEQALTDALRSVRDRGGIVIVIAHRPSALACVDQVLVLADGRAKALGPKDEVLSKLVRSVPRMPGVTPLEVVSATGGKQ